MTNTEQSQPGMLAVRQARRWHQVPKPSSGRGSHHTMRNSLLWPESGARGPHEQPSPHVSSSATEAVTVRVMVLMPWVEVECDRLVARELPDPVQGMADRMVTEIARGVAHHQTAGHRGPGVPRPGPRLG